MNKPAGALSLAESRCGAGILVTIEGNKHFFQRCGIRRRLFPGGKFEKTGLCRCGGITDAPNVKEITSLPEPVGKLQDGLFTHAVDEHIRLRVHQYGAPHPV